MNSLSIQMDSKPVIAIISIVNIAKLSKSLNNQVVLNEPLIIHKAEDGTKCY